MPSASSERSKTVWCRRFDRDANEVEDVFDPAVPSWSSCAANRARDARQTELDIVRKREAVMKPDSSTSCGSKEQGHAGHEHWLAVLVLVGLLVEHTVGNTT